MRAPRPRLILALILVLISRSRPVRGQHAVLAGPRRARPLQLRALPGRAGQFPILHRGLPARLPGRTQKPGSPRPEHRSPSATNSTNRRSTTWSLHRFMAYRRRFARITSLRRSLAQASSSCLMPSLVASSLRDRTRTGRGRVGGVPATTPGYGSQIGNDVLAELLFVAVSFILVKWPRHPLATRTKVHM